VIARIVLALLIAFAGSAAAAKPWPRMATSQSEVEIHTDAPSFVVRIPLKDVKGRVAYVLTCEGGSEEYMDTRFEDDLIWPMQCYAPPGLEFEDGSPRWHTRMHFRWDELVGACGDYPEFGRVRNFRVRGMRLTLEAHELRFAGDELKSFTLRVSVRPDAGANKEYTLRPGYLRPKWGDCSQVKRGKEPRMCRDFEREGGSWARCRDD
jgi:hypothetical protein